MNYTLDKDTPWKNLSAFKSKAAKIYVLLGIMLLATFFISGVSTRSKVMSDTNHNDSIGSKQYSLMRTSATLDVPASYPTRGVEGDLWADLIIGKNSFNDVVPNTVVSNKFFRPHSVIIDRSVTPNRMFIYDGGNSRVIGIADLQKCLSEGPNCQVSLDQGDIVIGQPDLTSAACNGDSAFQTYPILQSASASTLCSIPTIQLSVAESTTGSSMYISQDGDLYLNDMFNHRVLKYIKPFETDRIADEVWGQDDFSGNACNKGAAVPSASSLCFGWSGNNNWIAGVDVDIDGNTWVADSSNNRVLRFPQGSKSADLVLGQSDFGSNQPGNSLSKLHAPAAIRVTADKTVIVADYNNDRVMIYRNPTSSGESGQVLINIPFPEGVDFDPNYPGAVWIASRAQQNFELWTYDTSTPSKLKEIGQKYNGNLVNDPSGSIGVDSNGNYFIASPGAEWGADIIYYPKDGPYQVPTKKLFDGRNVMNSRDAKGLGVGVSIAIYEKDGVSQLIAMDDSRLMFWNDLNTLYSSKPADGLVETPDFSSVTNNGIFVTIKASKNHLYVSRSVGYKNHKIDIFKLPLTQGATAIKSLNSTFQLPDGSVIDVGQEGQAYWGIAPEVDDKYVWLSHADSSRVFRIRNPLTNPTIDVVLGQTDLVGRSCNFGGNDIVDAKPNSLCYPGWLSLDNFNNLFVSDFSPENRGNMRLLYYDKSLFPENNTQIIFTVNATKIFVHTAVAEVAFDSANHMVVGYQRYFTANPNEGKFPGVFLNPLKTGSFAPDMFLKDFSSAAFSTAFDSKDNLYVGDWARHRLHIYKKPLLAYLPTSTPTSSPTPTPVPPKWYPKYWNGINTAPTCNSVCSDLGLEAVSKCTGNLGCSGSNLCYQMPRLRTCLKTSVSCDTKVINLGRIPNQCCCQ